MLHLLLFVVSYIKSRMAEERKPRRKSPPTFVPPPPPLAKIGRILRTPDERFANLKDYPFKPNYFQVHSIF